MSEMRPIEILMAEDSPSDAMLATEALKNGKLSNKIHLVENGANALDFLFKRNGFENSPTPDLILLDINMPIKNGFEVLEELKKDERLRRIPVVMLTTVLTSLDDRAMVSSAIENGADSYLVKDKSDGNRIAVGILWAIRNRAAS